MLAITDNELSPVAPVASHVLYVKEARLGHFRSQVPAMVLCQTLVMSLGYRMPAAAVARAEPSRVRTRRIAPAGMLYRSSMIRRYAAVTRSTIAPNSMRRAPSGICRMVSSVVSTVRISAPTIVPV